MAQTDTNQLESQRNSNAHTDRMEGSAPETASTGSRLRPCRLALMWWVLPMLNDGKHMPQQVTGPPIYYRVPALLWSWGHAARPRVPGGRPTLD